MALSVQYIPFHVPILAVILSFLSEVTERFTNLIKNYHRHIDAPAPSTVITFNSIRY